MGGARGGCRWFARVASLFSFKERTARDPDEFLGGGGRGVLVCTVGRRWLSSPPRREQDPWWAARDPWGSDQGQNYGQTRNDFSTGSSWHVYDVRTYLTDAPWRRREIDDQPADRERPGPTRTRGASSANHRERRRLARRRHRRDDWRRRRQLYRRPQDRHQDLRLGVRLQDCRIYLLSRRGPRVIRRCNLTGRQNRVKMNIPWAMS